MMPPERLDPDRHTDGVVLRGCADCQRKTRDAIASREVIRNRLTYCEHARKERDMLMIAVGVCLGAIVAAFCDFAILSR